MSRVPAEGVKNVGALGCELLFTVIADLLAGLWPARGAEGTLGSARSGAAWIDMQELGMPFAYMFDGGVANQLLVHSFSLYSITCTASSVLVMIVCALLLIGSWCRCAIRALKTEQKSPLVEPQWSKSLHLPVDVATSRLASTRLGCPPRCMLTSPRNRSTQLCDLHHPNTGI